MFIPVECGNIHKTSAYFSNYSGASNIYVENGNKLYLLPVYENKLFFQSKKISRYLRN